MKQALLFIENGESLDTAILNENETDERPPSDSGTDPFPRHSCPPLLPTAMASAISASVSASISCIPAVASTAWRTIGVRYSALSPSIALSMPWLTQQPNRLSPQRRW